MNEQMIILFLLLIFIGITLFLYFWKAKKEIEYKKDERWQVIQYKAIKIADFSNYLLILLIGVGNAVSLYSDLQITFTFNRILIYSTFFIGFHNLLELSALKYFDKQL